MPGAVEFGSAGGVMVPGEAGGVAVPGEAGGVMVPGDAGSVAVPGEAGGVMVPGDAGSVAVPGDAGGVVGWRLVSLASAVLPAGGIGSSALLLRCSQAPSAARPSAPIALMRMVFLFVFMSANVVSASPSSSNEARRSRLVVD